MSDGVARGAVEPARLTWLVLAFAVCAAVIIARMVGLMVLDRDRYLAAMARESWREGAIPPARGRILDRDGRPLAWSTRRFVLRWRVPENKATVIRHWRTMSEGVTLAPQWSLASVLARRGQVIELSTDLSAADLRTLATLGEHVRDLRVSSSFARDRVPSPAVRSLLGETRAVNGVEVGVTGAEKVHDDLLRGVPGVYRVMVDKTGDWIAGTWQKTSEMRPGYDVYLPIRLQEGNQQP